ncbi:MAG: hypothetical protein HY964_03120 [Ignavibacteriales bacterium]|nr:hypothetical protein [Ignavibacteriales bacterium]
MKRLLAIWMIMALFAVNLLAQDEEESAPPTPPRRSIPAKIGGAGGFTQNLLFLNLNPINNYLKGAFAAEFDKTPMLLLGGQGYGYIMLVQNLRIGGVGATGSLKSAALDTGIEPNIRRDVELSVGFGGVTIEYVLPVLPRLDISAGIMLGAGSTNIKIWRNQSSNIKWDDVWNDFGHYQTVSSDFNHTLNGSFFVYQPQLNIEYAVLRWVGVRLGVAYNGMSASEWKYDDKYDLIGVPTNISGKGLMINGGIFLGTFLY